MMPFAKCEGVSVEVYPIPDKEKRLLRWIINWPNGLVSVFDGNNWEVEWGDRTFRLVEHGSEHEIVCNKLVKKAEG